MLLPPPPSLHPSFFPPCGPCGLWVGGACSLSAGTPQLPPLEGPCQGSTWVCRENRHSLASKATPPCRACTAPPRAGSDPRPAPSHLALGFCSQRLPVWEVWAGRWGHTGLAEFGSSCHPPCPPLFFLHSAPGGVESAKLPRNG